MSPTLTKVWVDVRIDGKTWTRQTEYRSLGAAWKAAMAAEHLLNSLRIPAKFNVREASHD